MSASLVLNSLTCCIYLNIFLSIYPSHLFFLPFLPPSDLRSPSCQSTSQQRPTTATCRWTAGWPIAAARRGSSCTSSDVIRWTGLTRSAGTLPWNKRTRTHPAALDWCWPAAIRWVTQTVLTVAPFTQPFGCCGQWNFALCETPTTKNLWTAAIIQLLCEKG